MGRQGFSSDELLEFVRQNHSFESVIGTLDDPVLYKHGVGVEWLYGADMTPGSFEFFGMPALYGRVLQPADYNPAAPPVFVLRYKAWKARFNGDPNVLNKVFVLNGTARTLVGIMPPRFGWYDADVWIPKTPHPGMSIGFAGLPERWFILGRLKQGVSVAQASADLTDIVNPWPSCARRTIQPSFSCSLCPLVTRVWGALNPRCISLWRLSDYCC